MEQVQVTKSDLSGILQTVEVLIDKIEHVLSQDEIAKVRIADIKTGRVQGRTEAELDEYLKKRGVKFERMGD